MKIELGLFEDPVPAKDAYPDFGSEKHRLASYNAAAESLVLLKNDAATLPLNGTESAPKLLVVGPTANSLNCMNGGWTHTWQGVETKYNTKGKKSIYVAIAEKRNGSVQFAQGCEIDSTSPAMLEQASKLAAEADAIVLCLGETPYTEKPGDIATLNLPSAQIELAQALAATGKPIILVLVEGRPRIVSEIEPLCSAVVYAGLPGNEGGVAIADMLYGDVNPSGKLPFTYPRNTNDLVTYDHKHTDKMDTKFGTDAFQPQWRFGHGLSYSSFAYSDFRISSDKISPDDKLKVSVTVTNKGSVTGKEVVQLYVADEVASITPPVERLRGFDKIELAPAESRTVSFDVSPRDLAFVGLQNEWVVEEGYFSARIGEHSERFYLKKGAAFLGER